ncbi:hypothetical protein AVEN_217167-1 [Araneus ventricosus]|uniref:Uncharacterized protein n=1 Tax=Araneus ventricosus TaxID=182803 RepID=A0A4Y2GQT8_ARAVE|nr:hypothetical protein AVEN_217167-1 [Araneus ventricosus]
MNLTQQTCTLALSNLLHAYRFAVQDCCNLKLLSGIPLKIRRVRNFMVNRSPVVVVRKFGEVVPAEASSYASDRESKLRAQSQKSHRASKQVINIMKQRGLFWYPRLGWETSFSVNVRKSGVSQPGVPE